MKVAILSESPADEAAVRVLVDAILGTTTEPVDLSLRSRGWPSVRDILPTVLRQIHFHTDVEHVVAVADANHAPLHDATLTAEACADTGCRLCVLRTLAATTCSRLRPVPGKQPLQVAIGLAVPSIEAWWHWDGKRSVSEAVWADGRRARRDPYTKNRLKALVYGTDRPGLPLEKARMVTEANRVCAHLDAFETAFPAGFGGLLATLRAWRPGS